MIELRDLKNFLKTDKEITHNDGCFTITKPLDIAVFNFLCDAQQLKNSLEELSIDREKINLIIPNILK